jgi:hypothetical protein
MLTYREILWLAESYGTPEPIRERCERILLLRYGVLPALF